MTTDPFENDWRVPALSESLPTDEFRTAHLDDWYDVSGFVLSASVGDPGTETFTPSAGTSVFKAGGLEDVTHEMLAPPPPPPAPADGICPTCSNVGYLLGQTYDCATVPLGWTTVQACDSCFVFDSDYLAALSAQRSHQADAIAYFAVGLPDSDEWSPETSTEEGLGDWAIHGAYDRPETPAGDLSSPALFHPDDGVLEFAGHIFVMRDVRPGNVTGNSGDRHVGVYVAAAIAAAQANAAPAAPDTEELGATYRRMIGLILTAIDNLVDLSHDRRFHPDVDLPALTLPEARRLISVLVSSTAGAVIQASTIPPEMWAARLMDHLEQRQANHSESWAW